jgi:Protein of unknown function (DUF2934)
VQAVARLAADRDPVIAHTHDATFSACFRTILRPLRPGQRQRAAIRHNLVYISNYCIILCILKVIFIMKNQLKTSNSLKGKTPKNTDPLLSNKQVALHAYYIGERRRNLGSPGDETSDWLQAERKISQELECYKFAVSSGDRAPHHHTER